MRFTTLPTLRAPRPLCLTRPPRPAIRPPHAAAGDGAPDDVPRFTSGRNAAVALPWYHITPARTFLAASSLKLLALSLPNSTFPLTLAASTGCLVPLDLAQTAAAVVGGTCLALLARRLDETGFMGTRWAWPKLIVGCVFVAWLAARILPRRLTVAPAFRRPARPAAAEQAEPRAPAGPPRLRTAAEADAEVAALMQGAAPPKRGRAPAVVVRR